MRRIPLATALLVVLVILAGCKADSAPSASGAASPSPTPTSVAEATAAAESTATPGPTATTTSAVQIEVIGDDEFKAWAARALELIEAKAPEAFAEVRASIDVIESVTAGSGMYVEEKRFAVGDETAHAPGYDEEGQLLWFAGAIVHDAHHSDQFIRGVPHTGKEAELECLTGQQAALHLMSDEPFFPTYLQGLIDGADDPANQYWNQANRHW